jgi:hypothetical protein
VIEGDRFHNDEIKHNLLLLTLCSISSLAGVFPHLINYFSQCFWGCQICNIPLPLPICFLAPPEFDILPPDAMFREIIRRMAYPHHIHTKSP